MQLRVSGKGNEPVSDEISGDLLILIDEKEDPNLKREGNNLHYDCHISFPDAVLGSSKEIEVVKGKARIKLNQEFNLEKFEAKNKGLKSLNGPTGDLLVHVNVWTQKQ